MDYFCVINSHHLFYILLHTKELTNTLVAHFQDFSYDSGILRTCFGKSFLYVSSPHSWCILARGGDRVKDEKGKSENRSVSDKERQVQHDRNNENAKARAEVEPRAPRINTDNL